MVEVLIDHRVEYNTNMTVEVKKPKRRWLRFSLRTFLIVLTIFCVWLGWYLYRVEQQRNAVKWVEENGGEVRYDYQFDSKGVRLGNSQPSVPKWLLNILDVNYFSSIVSVEISDASQITNLTPIACLTNLERLYLDDAQVTDLQPLAGLTSLEILFLETTPVNDLTPFAGLTNLKWLGFGNSQVSDLTPLASLKNLSNLWLLETKAGDWSPFPNRLTQFEMLFHLAPIIGVDNKLSASPKNREVVLNENSQIGEQEISILQQALPNCNIYKN